MSANVDYLLPRLLGNTKLRPVACMGSGWGFGQNEIGAMGHVAKSESNA